MTENQHGRLRSLYAYPVEQAPLDRAADRLFVLVYVMVFAGALLAEALTARSYSVTQSAARLSAPRRGVRFRQGAAVRHHRHGDLDLHRLPIPPVDDRRGDRRAAGHAQGGTAALQSAGKPVHLARHHHADAAHCRRRCAQRLRHRPQRQAIFHHSHARADRGARRRRARGRARPRADAYPQRRRAHDGDRGGDRRRDLVLRRVDVPLVLPGELLGGGRRSDGERKGGGAGIAIVIAHRARS